MGALVQHAIFALAGLVALGTIFATIRPEVERIRAVLRWRTHDERVELARRPGEVRS